MARFKIITGEKWEYKYNDHEIVVVNDIDRCELIIDGKVQDAHNGFALSAALNGKVSNKAVKVSVGGLWNVKCSVFVGNEHLDFVKKSEF